MRPPHLAALSFSFLLLLTPLYSQLVRMPITKDSQSTSQSGFLNFKAKSGSIDILNVMNSQYSGTIQIGSSGASFKVVLDTGSSELWIPDSSMKDNSWNSYDCSSSSTCKVQRQRSIPLTYGKGSIIGYKAVDQVQFGGLTIPQYDMLLAYEIDDMPRGNFDGILGLSLGRNLAEYPTLLETLKNNGLIGTGTFSMYLGDDASSYGGATGEIIFGGHDPKYAMSEFKFVNIYNDTIYWAADMQAISYGGSQNMSVGVFPAIFDSGTSLLMLPQRVIDEIIYQATLDGINCYYDYSTELYTCDCAASDILKDLVFYFNGVTLTASASSYIIYNGGKCQLGIQAGPAMPTIYEPAIIGDVVLKSYYTLYTADNSTVGFAQALPIKHYPVGIVLLILLTISLVIALGVYLYNQRKQKVQPSLFSGPGRLIGGSSASSGSYFKNMRSRGITIGSDYAEMINAQISNTERLITADSKEVREYPTFST